MNAWIDHDALEEGYLVVHMDPQGKYVPTRLTLPDGHEVEMVISESVSTADNEPVYEIKGE